MNFIKKIFESQGKLIEDDSIHLQFQKFSRGEFRNRAQKKAKRTGSKYTISTSAEFANELVKKAAEKLGQENARVIGAIVSTSDLKEDLDFKEIKQFQGVKRYLIDKEISGEELVSLLEKFPKAFFALSFDVGEETKLKIKPKAPKSGKPGKKGEEKPKADFCKLVTTDKAWGEGFVFEKPEFKNAEISHNFFIEELIRPKGEEDFAKIRELSKRKGRIVREAEIDGVESSKETGFEA